LEGRLGRRVALIGDPVMVSRLHANLTSSDEQFVHVTGLYCDDAALDESPNRNFSALNGDCDTLIQDLRNQSVDSVVVALPDNHPERLLQIKSRLTAVPVDVQLRLGDHSPPGTETGLDVLAGVPVVAVVERPLRGWRSILKEIEDRIIGFAILIGISPILLLIAIAIKLDSRGPVFFKQPRTGYNNRIIEVYKFRTMYVDQSDARGSRLTERDDPRVTRLGRFLRKWSLDELPQFFNVLNGEMSIVGPRPHALSAKAGGKLYRDAAPGYDARHRVKPGITGLAQISGWRGPTETERQIRKRVEHDLLYIENWSLWLDMKIIVATAFTGFNSENAF
jgi:Undecaprenyl-phosphate glucose phosphotransferase